MVENRLAGSVDHNSLPQRGRLQSRNARERTRRRSQPKLSLERLVAPCRKTALCSRSLSDERTRGRRDRRTHRSIRSKTFNSLSLLGALRGSDRKSRADRRDTARAEQRLSTQARNRLPDTRKSEPLRLARSTNSRHLHRRARAPFRSHNDLAEI